MSDDLTNDWLDPSLWDACGHDAPFPLCAACRKPLEAKFGTDGSVIVAFGVCEPCATTTVWNHVDAGSVGQENQG